MPIPPLNIEGAPVGDGHPCFVIAEIGSNHNNDLQLAYEHIDAAAEAGANAVKFQTFKADKHYSKKTPGFSYLKNTDTYNLIRSLELDRSWHVHLKKRADQKGVVFFSSPCDLEAIDDLARLGVGVYKVASFDLPDTELITSMAKTQKPVILSTGMANWMDIQRGIDACMSCGNGQIALLQCTSLYPAPPELTNLKSIVSMRSAFNLPTGYSDHTIGCHMAIAAVALGACIIEKHFTLDPRLEGPDHPFAMAPEGLKTMIAQIREVETGMGDGVKTGPAEAEKEMFEKGRRSLHAAADIAKGDIITEKMLVVKRPGLGISPRMKEIVIGRQARISIDADQWITWDMV